MYCENAPRCMYVNGRVPRYQYCRLSSKYKMGKYPNCKVTKRLKKAEIKRNASVRIYQFVNENLKRQKTMKNKKKYEKEPKAREVIGRFMKNTEIKRKSEFLKSLCSDSGVCIAFGNYRKKIIDFFNGFVHFDYVKPPIKSIGAVSNNGFVKELKYERNGYIAHTVLKSSIKNDSDNLVYEYIVGLFINKISKFFPCFVETYGLYYYKTPDKWSHMKDTVNVTNNVLRESLELQNNDNEYNYAKVCQDSKYASLLIQHLNNVNAFGNIFQKKPLNDISIKDFLLYDCLFVFYQIYFPLSILKKIFTHYDLHSDNVLLYEPVKGKYIEYHYYLKNGKKIQFKSKYIVKIIDYGRSFFKYSDKKELSPSVIYKKVCSEPLCNPDCGEEYGFGWFNKNREEESDSFFINSNFRNQSHDMRLLYNFYTDIISKHNYVNEYSKKEEKIIINELIIFLSKIVYGIGLDQSDKLYGTEENTKSGLPNKINNVADIEIALRDIINKVPFVKQINNNLYSNSVNKLGDMYIYTDGKPMKFEPNI